MYTEPGKEFLRQRKDLCKGPEAGMCSVLESQKPGMAESGRIGEQLGRQDEDQVIEGFTGCGKEFCIYSRSNGSYMRVCFLTYAFKRPLWCCHNDSWECKHASGNPTEETVHLFTLQGFTEHLCAR